MTSFIKDLDSNQKKAVCHNDGPLLVLAGAGSGKTRVLTFRIARLIKEKKCKPEEILSLTFTNKAAREMQERVAKITSKQTAQKMTISTFHSFGVKVLREFGEHVGLADYFSILAENERTSILKTIMRSTSQTIAKENPLNYSSDIGLAKNSNLTPDQLSEEYPEKNKVSRVFKKYQTVLKKRHLVDFDDLLLLPLELFKKHPKVLAVYRKRYKFISIDEFQDTNQVQMKIAQLIAAPKNNVLVVGDDDQGIYSWRGAQIENILNFGSYFKKSKTVILDKNYRSTEHIVNGAYGVVARNQKRKLKQVKAMQKSNFPIATYFAADELEEVQWIIETIQKQVKQKRFAYKSHAILLRTNALMRRFEEEFRIQRIPYHIQGAMSFFDRKEVKDIFAYLRFFGNTNDEVSLLRMIKVPNWGITKSTIEKLEELAGRRRTSLWHAFEHFNELRELQPIQAEKLQSLIDFYQKFSILFQKKSLATTTKNLLDHIGYIDLLQKSYKNEKSLPIRLENVEEIVHGIELYEKRTKGGSLADYLQKCVLLTNDDPDEEKKQKGVIIMTLHKAKGLEFPVVFMPVLDSAVIPSPRSVEEGGIEEERRLFYVGMTRAKSRLYLSCPSTKVYFKKNVDVKPCRFIYEIPEEHCDGKFGEKEEQDRQQENVDFFAEMKKKFSSNSQ